MQKKEDILKEIARLRAASPAEAGGAFTPILEAVEGFFAPDKELEQEIGECALQVAFNYEYRSTIYKNQENMPKFSEDLPPGYEDVRELFTAGGVWEEIKGMPEDVFAAAFILQEAGGNVSNLDTSGTGAATNPYLDDWAARIKAARAAVIQGLKNINQFCEAEVTRYSAAVYFEEHGGIVSTPNRREKAERVYIAGGYLEVIQTYGLNTHIPSYYRGIE